MLFIADFFPLGSTAERLSHMGTVEFKTMKYRTLALIVAAAVSILIFFPDHSVAAPWTPFEWQDGGRHRNWPRDRDNNFVDDLIDSTSGDHLTVIVELNGCLEATPGKGDVGLIAFLNDVGVVRYIGKYLSFMIVDKVPADRAADIAARPEVAMVELALSPILLDTDRRALKVENSVANPDNLESRLDWPATLNGAGVNIAILDTGVADDLDPDLAGRFRFGADCTVDWEECTITNPDDSTYGGAGDPHGTSMARIALGAGDSGIAPGAGLVDIRVATPGAGGLPGGVERALELVYEMRQRDDAWAIGVVNLSLAQGTGGVFVPDDGTSASAQLVNLLQGHGIVVVAGAGPNGGEPPCVADPSSCEIITAPGSASRAITVIAADPNGTDSRGNDTIELVPTGPRESDDDGDPLDELKPELATPSCCGNSPATARTSGVSALILQAVPDINPGSVKDLLIRTAELQVTLAEADTTERYPHDDPTWDTRWGFGETDAYRAFADRQDASLITDVTFRDLYATDHPTPWYDSLAITTDRLDRGLSIESDAPDTIRVQVWNQGQIPAQRVKLRFGFYPFTAGIPAFQDIGTMVVDLEDGEAQTFEYPWTPPRLPGGEEHGCLLVSIDYGYDTDYSNRSNVAQKNIRVLGAGSPADVEFRVENILPVPAAIQLVTLEDHPDWTLTLSETEFVMQPQECARVIRATVDPSPGVEGGTEVTYHITAIARPKEGQGSPTEIGGVTLRVRKASAPFPWAYVIGISVMVLIVAYFALVRRRKSPV